MAGINYCLTAPRQENKCRIKKYLSSFGAGAGVGAGVGVSNVFSADADTSAAYFKRSLLNGSEQNTPYKT